MTGTSAGKILLANSTLRECVGLPPHSDFEDVALTERLSSIDQTWFSSSRSTEAMMRG